jgi:putative DNA primase/helicase
VTGEVERWAKEVSEEVLDKARATRDDRLFRWGLRCQSASVIRNSLKLAQTEPGVPVLVDDLDQYAYLLTVANCTLNLRTGEALTPQREHLITQTSPVSWDPNAKCPTWRAFLERVQPGPEVRHVMKRACGYALTGAVSEQVLLVLYGTGATGKSVLKETVLALLGDLAKPTAPKLLLASRHQEHPTQIADLCGRRLVVTHEVEEGARLDESLVKELTGGDRLKARRMREDYWDFAPTFKLWLACNHKPRIKGTDNGIWRRIRLVEFPITIPADQQDRDLASKLRAEPPGILTWAVEGCLEWQRHGLQAPAAVTEATAAYKKESDLIAQFVDECSLVGDRFQVKGTLLYDSYKTWCVANGLDHPLSLKALTKQLDEQGYDRSQDRTKANIWTGLGLKSEAAT